MKGGIHYLFLLSLTLSMSSYCSVLSYEAWGDVCSHMPGGNNWNWESVLEDNSCSLREICICRQTRMRGRVVYLYFAMTPYPVCVHYLFSHIYVKWITSAQYACGCYLHFFLFIYPIPMFYVTIIWMECSDPPCPPTKWGYFALLEAHIYQKLKSNIIIAYNS